MKIIDSLIKTITPATQGTATAASASAKAADTGVNSAAPTADSASEGGKIIADLKAQGYEISTDEADKISEFIEKTEGSESEKLQTVKTALDKGLPLTLKSLQSIQAALFRPTLPEELHNLLEAAGSEFSMERAELLRAIVKLAAAEEAGEPLYISSHTMDATVVLGNEKTAGAAGGVEKVSAGLLASDREAVVLNWLMEALEQVAVLSEKLVGADGDAGEADVLGARGPHPLAPSKPETDNAMETPVIEAELAENVEERPDNERTAEVQQGREKETDSGPRVKAAVAKLVSALEDQKDLAAPPSEALIQGMTLLMKEITPRMAEIKAEFETLRKSVTADLTAVKTELGKTESVDKPKAAEKLTQAIEKLDKAILKSDIPLYTSMKAEKQLLKWSSELQEARSLVSGGKNTEASAIVERVAKGLGELQFQPAKLKVIHRTLQQAATGDDFREKGLQQRAQEQVSRILEPIQTPRDVLEAFKALGLTHEAEVVSVLGQSNKRLKDDWLPQENLKEILMKLASETEEKLTTVTGAEKALNNLTGQQLLSRPEAKPQGQTMFFSLPMALSNRVEDLKIYVQSRKDNGKVDWENCTFYFAVHTEKYGDVGIRFAAARKSVSIQVKCDNQALRDAVSPMVDDFKQAMWETGYKIAGISYSPLKESKPAMQKAEENAEPEADGKGLNIRV